LTNVVSNTGPLIALAQIGQFDLLRRLFGKIIIPPAVRAEIQDETSVTALTAADWITVQPAQDTLAAQLLREELDAGESAAIVLAKELGADLVLIDERAAARKACALGLRVIGTLGVLLLGKRAEHLSTIKPLLDSLGKNDFRMSANLYDQVLRDAGEF
jgi:predicted nucleic acid-binding protein